MVEPHIYSQEFRVSSFPHARPLPPSFAFLPLVLCRGYLRYMMSVEILKHHLHHVPDLDWDKHSCQKKLHKLFLALGFVLNQPKILPRT